MENQKITELFAESTLRKNVKWNNLLAKQQCPFINKKCVKIRKSEPSISIGTCTVAIALTQSTLCYLYFSKRAKMKNSK